MIEEAIESEARVYVTVVHHYEDVVIGDPLERFTGELLPVVDNLERALEFIDDDELVEVTPKNIRIRKKFLLEHERKRASRSSAA